MIRGGTAINIVPGHCGFEFEFRVVPADEAPMPSSRRSCRFAAGELGARDARPSVPGSRIDFNAHIRAIRGWDTAEDDPGRRPPPSG